MSDARKIINEATRPDPKRVMMRDLGRVVLTGGLDVDKIKKARAAIYRHYGTEDWDAISATAAALRTGSEHEESSQSGRDYCRVCGFVDNDYRQLPDPIYHPDWWRP